MQSKRLGAQALSRTVRTAQAEPRTDEFGILRGGGMSPPHPHLVLIKKVQSYCNFWIKHLGIFILLGRIRK
jgi:hypothetical protein